MSAPPFYVRFNVLGIAAPQGSFRAATSRKTGRAFLVQSNKRTMPWRQEVAARAQEAMHAAGLAICNRPMHLTLRVYLPRPNGHYGAKGLRPSAPTWPAKKPDLSKLVRAVEDAMTGIVYLDDAQICDELMFKRYADDGPPRAEVLVEELA